MAVWAFSQTFGYMIWINIDFKYDWIKFFTVAGLYLIVALIDFFTFVGHPAQVNIFVEDAQDLLREKEMFDELNATVTLRKSRGQSYDRLSVFELMEK